MTSKRLGRRGALLSAALASRALGGPPAAAADEVPTGAPRTWRASMSVEYGTLRRPSECLGYCQNAYGPALGVAAGHMMSPRLALVAEGWLFQRDALGGFIGAQLWLGEGAAWLRGSGGIMSTSHHNADGGPGGGTGPALSASGGVTLSCFGDFSSELSARLAAVEHDLGLVTSFTVGYGIAW